MPMISILNLTQSFNNQVLYDNITFNIGPKEKIGLVGRNGHGKTTLFHIILGNIKPDSGTISISKNYRIGYLQQHINFTQDTILKEACLGLREEDKYDTWKAEKILSGLGFSEEDIEKHPSIFSGGYQIRLNLAKLLVSEPDLLLLDEPNNYLDIVASRWLKNFLKSWKTEFMLITHDRNFMDSITTHTIAIHRQKIKKVKGHTQKAYNQIAEEEDVYEQTRINEENKRRQLQVFIDRFKAKARLAGQVQSKIKMLEKMGEKEQLHQIDTLAFSFNSIPFVSAQMMSINKLSFSYDNKHPYLISDFSLNIGKKERIGVIGKNGKGKSTLLKLLAKELSPINGTIKFHQELTTGYFGQPNVMRLYPENTVVDEILNSSTDCSLQYARDIAGMLMFDGDNALKPISVLSGGEKNRVMLAKIVVSPCHLLLLDEPTNHLDMDSCEALLEAIDKFAGSVVIVTHDEMFLKKIAKRLVIFDNSRILVYEGGYQDFLDNIGWKDETDIKNQALKTIPHVHNNGKSGKTPQENKEPDTSPDINLKPLKKELTKLEKNIAELKNKINENNELMAKAAVEKNIHVIIDTSKLNKELTAELEILASRHTTLNSEYETLLLESGQI